LDSAAILVEPWLLSENDLHWCISLGKKKYPSNYDPLATEGWLRNIVFKGPLMFHPVRTAHAFCISMISCLPWLPSDFEAHVVAICADDGAMWEAAKLLRDSIAWAKSRRCKCWRLCSDTDYDLAGMARRLGAKEISPRFTMEF
jgi:hypothetical protein